jgi:autotransporter-associated beta strand protein
MTLRDSSKLVLQDGVFTPTALAVGDAVEIDLNANVPWAVNGTKQQVMIGVPGYNATLRIERDDALIGAVNSDAASLLSPIAGTAATLTFRGGNKLLQVGDDTVPILTDLAPGGSTAVVIDRDLTLAAPNTYTGGTTITSGTTRAATVSALGSGPVTLVTPVPPNPGPALQLRAEGLISGPITVNAGTTLVYYRRALSPVTFAGGTIAAARDAIAAGALVDGDVTEFAVPSEKALIFTEPLAMTADRFWTIPSGTVVFSGDVTGAKNLTKMGGGTLQLGGGGNDIAGLFIGVPSAGGTVLVTGKVPTAVTVNAGSAYSVAAFNHSYAEVNMAASAGVLALAADNNKPLTMLNGDMSLGALADATYSGLLTPAGSTYNLGGGGAVLTVTSDLTDDHETMPSIIRNMRIGWQSPGGNDPIAKGMVILAGPVSVHGNIDIYGAAGITTDVSSAAFVNVNAGGSIDLANQPVPFNLFLLGGGVARTGSTLTYDDFFTLPLLQFGDNYVLGSGGSGNTDVADGALVANGGASLIKVGTNQVTLNMPAVPGSSLNTYDGGGTEVREGTLVVKDLSSLAQTFTLTASGGVLRLERSGTFVGGITLDNAASLFVASGEAIVAEYGLTIGGPTARPSLTGGGTLDTNGLVVMGGGGGGAILDITEGATLITKLGSTAEMNANLFKIREGSTLSFMTATPVGTNQNQQVGWMYPGSTLELGPDLAAGGKWNTIAGHPGITLDVDQAEYDTIGQAAFSSESRPYRFRIGFGSRLDMWDSGAGGDGNLMTAVLPGNWGNHRPVAFIEKAGEGEMRVYKTFNPASTDTRLLAWIVTGGTLAAYEDTGLGATAADWLASGKNPAIVQQHLESVVVKDGATLAWRGQPGFLPASAYGGLPAGEGKGFGPGDFVLQDNATLTNSNAPLTLGTQGLGQTYLCYPTIQSTGAIPNVTIKGNVNLRSGIAIDPVSLPGGLTDMTVSGAVKFTSDLPGAIGTDVIRNLTHTSGTTTIMTDQTHLKLLKVEAGSVEFAPTGTIAIGAPVVDLATAGNLRARSGVVDMANALITSSAPPAAYAPGLLQGRLAGAFDTTNYPATTTVTLGADMAQTNLKPPWGDNETWVYTGEFYQAVDGTVTFAENVDDSALLKIDGVTWLNNTSYTTPTSSAKILTAGWHTFEARFGNGTGGAGPSGQNTNGWTNWSTSFGFGYKQGAATLNAADYAKPIDDGTGNLFHVMTVNGVVTVDAGATLNARGFQGVNIVNLQGVMAIGQDGSTSTTRELKLAESGGLATGKLDITNGSLVIDYSADAPSPLPQVKSWIRQGYNNMAWDSNGITSSAAALHPIIYGVGYTQNDMLFAPYHVFSGQPVDLSTVLVKFTYAGDVNLDGSVDDNDVAIIGLFYDNGRTSSHYWNQGDVFGYDGRIDDNDVAIIGLTYGLGIGDPLGGGPAGAVPEPATLALLALGGLATLVARRHAR